MAYLGELRRKFEQLDRDTDFVIEESFNSTAQAFGDTQRTQLSEGFTREGLKITPKYANDAYARMKQGMNSLPGFGNPDLKLTGSFHRQIVVDSRASEGIIVVDSSDEKSQDLQDKYGEEIFGLGGSFKLQYIDESLRPELFGRVAKITGLSFASQ